MPLLNSFLRSWSQLGRNARVVAISMILWAVGEGLWWHIQPLYLAALGASPEQIGFILAVAGFARLIIMLPAGWLGDKYGARRVMLPGWFLGMVGVALIAAAPNFYILAVGFFFYGLSASALPMINLYIVQSLKFDPTAHPALPPQRALTFIYGLFWMGMIFSPAAGGIIAEWLSLRAVFWVSVAWFIISTITIFQTRPYPQPVTAHPPTAANRLRLYVDLLRDWRLRLTYFVFVIGFIATILGYTFIPKFLDDVRDLPTSTIGILSSLLAIGGFMWNILLGRQNPWAGFLAAVMLSGLAFILLILFDNLLIIAAAYLLIAAFEALRPVSTSIIAHQVSPEQQGVAFSLVDTLHGVGSFLAPAIAGLAYAQTQALPFFIALALIPIVFVGGIITNAKPRAALPIVEPTLHPQAEIIGGGK